MGKGRRNRQNRYAQKGSKLSRSEVLSQTGSLVPLPPETWCVGSLYWITGVLWKHDKLIIEPFLAEWCGWWNIMDLDSWTIDYHYAKLLLASESMMVYSDRLDAITVCDAMRDEKTLLDGLMEFMPKEAMQEYLENKVGGYDE